MDGWGHPPHWCERLWRRSPLAHGLTGLVVVLMALPACRGAPPEPAASSPTPTAPPAATATPLERAVPTPEQQTATSAERSLGPPTTGPFPRATSTTAGDETVLWSAWPMEGRDPQRTNRAPIAGPRTGRLLWAVEIDEPSFSQVVDAADGTLYVGTATGKLQAVRRTGVAWSFEAGPPVPTPAVGLDGTVYARGGDGSLHALAADGRRRWTTDIGAEPRLLGPAPTVGPDSYVAMTSYHQGLVYLLQPGGFFQWAVNTQARTLAAAAIGPDGIVYAGSADGTVRALDRDGIELWRANLSVPIVGPPAIGPTGIAHVLLGDGPAELVAVGADGGVRWRAPACWSRGAPIAWAALATDGRVQVGACAIGQTGAVIWSAPLDGPWATPSALDADGTAFTASGRSAYALNPDGSMRWRLELESEALMPPSIGRDGVVYLSGARPNRLYAIGPG